MSAPIKTPEVSRNQAELMERSRRAMLRREQQERAEAIGAAIHYKPHKPKLDESVFDFTQMNFDVGD